MTTSSDTPAPANGRFALALVALVLGIGSLVSERQFGASRLHDGLDDAAVVIVYLVAVVLAFRNARRAGSDRLALTCLAVGIASYAAATPCYLLLAHGSVAPVASHVLWTAFYPLAYVSLLLMLRSRLQRMPRSLWLDGAIGALTLASVAVLLVPPDLATRSDTFDTAAYVLYLIGDVVLLTLGLLAASLTGWRPGRGLMTILGGLVLLGAADCVLIWTGASGAIDHSIIMNSAYPLAMLIVALGMAGPPPELRGHQPDRITRLAFPGICLVVALGLVMTDQFVTFPNDRVVLPLVVIALAAVRAAVTLSDLRRLYESRRFERGFQDANIGMAVLSQELCWLRVNQAWADMLGYGIDELVGRSAFDVIHPDDHGPTTSRRDTAFAGDEPSAREMRFVCADGTVKYIQATTTLVTDDAESHPYFFSQMSDVTDRRRAAAQREAVAELGHLALETTDVRPLVHQAVRIVAETMAVDHCAVAGLTPDGDCLRFEAISDSIFPLDHLLPTGTDSMAGYTLMQDGPVLSDDLTTETRFRVTQRTLDAGLCRAVGVPIRRRGAATQQVLVMQETARARRFGDDDVRFLQAIANVLTSALDRVATEDELRRRALEDPLTGLANRALLASQLERGLRAAGRRDREVAVLLLDLDRFKYLNDTLGHSTGDELLREVAVRLGREVRDEDLVARLGGDEFVVVCADASDEAAVAEVAQRVVDVIGEPFNVGARELFVSTSVGVAVGGGGASAEGLLSDADAAMYRAKEQGGARYEVFDADLRGRLMQRLSTEAALRRALDRGELEVQYQPIVEIATGRYAMFEALLRWHHPERGAISPVEFIPIAEETGLIERIGCWVLETAAREAAEWNRGDREVSVSINLSPRQVTAELPGLVAQVLAATGLPAGLLSLEITESLLLEQASTTPVLDELRRMGVHVALDDFGTGYSSLSYLQTYPIDLLKLDRGFVASLDESPATAAVVKAAIDMAGALGQRVVAEGVERREQFDCLRELGCSYAQGFLFAGAMPAADVPSLTSAPPRAVAPV